MITTVTAVTRVVKNDELVTVDYRSSRAQTTEVTTLLERLQRVIDEGWVEGVGQWGEAATGNRSHVSALMFRLKNKATAGVEVDTLIKMADAAKVEFNWLARGEGPPRKPEAREPTIDPDDRYPNRARAIAAARNLGKSETAISDVLEMSLKANEDPPADWWFEKIAEADRREKDPFLTAPPGRKIGEDSDF